MWITIFNAFIDVIASAFWLGVMALASIIVVTLFNRKRSHHSFWPSMILSWMFWIFAMTSLFLALINRNWVIMDANYWGFVAASLIYGIFYKSLYEENVTRITDEGSD